MQGNAELWAKGIATLVRDHVEKATAPLREEVARLNETRADRASLAATQLDNDGLRDDIAELRNEMPDPEAFVERLANALTARLIA